MTMIPFDSYDFYFDSIKNIDVLTNFSSDQTDLYLASMYIYKKTHNHNLYIREDAYDVTGKPVTYLKALILENKIKVGDMSPFWRIFDDLRNDNNFLQQTLSVMNRKNKFNKLFK